MINKSGISYILNNKTNKSIRWCTPSILPEADKVLNPYESDMSVSFQSLGFPSEPSGIFATAYKKAAKAYGADQTLFCVNGSTGSNFVVLRALTKQIPNLRVLAQRNIHKSVKVACEDYRINLVFLPENIDEKTQFFLPNSVEEISEHIKKTKSQVLLITNPTYEGVVLDLNRLVKIIRRKYPNLIVFIEEAWGSHLFFSDKLPVSAMEAGADICVQSTHKQGGALQQTSMIHWKGKRINSELLIDSYKALSTSSPSYTLLASLDAVRVVMEKNGREKIDNLLYIAKLLSSKLDSIIGFKVIDTESLKNNNPSIFNRDETKIILDVSQSGYSGFEIAKLLERKYNIIVEKYNERSLLILVPFQAKLSDVEVTVRAFKSIVGDAKESHSKRLIPNGGIPKNRPKILESVEVTNLLVDQIEKISITDAIGRIAAEDITPYPPGIPLTIKGDEITIEIVKYYQKLKNHPNSHILANDETLETILVVK